MIYFLDIPPEATAYEWNEDSHLLFRDTALHTRRATRGLDEALDAGCDVMIVPDTTDWYFGRTFANEPAYIEWQRRYHHLAAYDLYACVEPVWGDPSARRTIRNRFERAGLSLMPSYIVGEDPPSHLNQFAGKSVFCLLRNATAADWIRLYKQAKNLDINVHAAGVYPSPFLLTFPFESASSFGRNWSDIAANAYCALQVSGHLPGGYHASDKEQRWEWAKLCCYTVRMWELNYGGIHERLYHHHG